MDIMDVMELLNRPAVMSAITTELSGMGYKGYREFEQAVSQMADQASELMTLAGDWQKWFMDMAEKAEAACGKDSPEYIRWQHRVERIKPFVSRWGRYKYKLEFALTELGQKIGDEVIAANQEEYKRYMQDDAIDKARRYLDNIPALDALEAEWQRERRELREQNYELDKVCRTGCKEKIHTGSPFDPLCPVDKYGLPTCETQRALAGIDAKIRELDGRYYGKREELGEGEWVTDPAEGIYTLTEDYPQSLHSRWERVTYKDTEAFEAGKQYYAGLFKRLGIDKYVKEATDETWKERLIRQEETKNEMSFYDDE